MSEEIFDKVKKIISDQFNKKDDEIEFDTSFYNDLGADSLDLFEIITRLEDEFGLEFTNEAAEKIRTVKDAVEYIQKNAK
jgi:acyl carrier protein